MSPSPSSITRTEPNQAATWSSSPRLAWSSLILAGVIIAVATRGRLGLRRPHSDADLHSELTH